MKRCLSLLSLLLAPAAHGAIVYSGVQNIAVPQTFAGVYVNVVTHDTVFSQPADFDTAPWINFDFGGVDISNGDLVTVVVNPPDAVENLAPGTDVGSPSNFSTAPNFSSDHTGPAAGQFQVATPGYLGFGFQLSSGGPTYYGWAKVTIDNTTAGTVHEWAYEDTPATTITVGTVPEPAGAALVLAGLAALQFRRRR